MPSHPFKPRKGRSAAAQFIIHNSLFSAARAQSGHDLARLAHKIDPLYTWADIVLPDACFLERYTPAVSFPSTFSHPQGEDDWGWTIRQPVIEPLYERRDFNEVMLDICKRLGILGKYYKGLNDSIGIRYGGEMSEKYKDMGQKLYLPEGEA